MDWKALLEDIGPWEWPMGLERKLEPILRDKDGADPEQRVAAVSVAGDYTQINDRLADALIWIVENPAESDEIRADAAIAFGPALEQGYIEEFIEPENVPISEEIYDRIRDVLKRVYLDQSTPKSVRRRAMEGSIRAPDDWHEEEVRKAYASGDREWKLTAVFCMSHLRGFDKEILESLESDDPELHLEAVRAAGSFEIEAAWSHIADLARSELAEKELRIVAIEALSTLRPKDSLEILIRLSDDDDEDIAEAADEAQTMAVGFLEKDEDDDVFDEEDDEDDDEDDDKKPKLVN
ncbi:MAG: hypothetical protein ABI806_15130 [Candidatus Solibacter sp.]